MTHSFTDKNLSLLPSAFARAGELQDITPGATCLLMAIWANEGVAKGWELEQLTGLSRHTIRNQRSILLRSRRLARTGPLKTPTYFLTEEGEEIAKAIFAVIVKTLAIKEQAA